MSESKKCALCACGGPLVEITCARSDTAEVLDTACLCPECFAGSFELGELFTGSVVGTDEAGVAHLAGQGPPEEGGS